MNKNKFKLNRSLSESNLSDTTYDNSAVGNFFAVVNKKVPTVFTRSLYVEEIIDGGFSTKIRRYASCKEIIDQGITKESTNTATTFSNIFTTEYFCEPICFDSQSNLNVSNCIPMDVDFSNDCKRTNEYIEEMDTDSTYEYHQYPQNSKEERYKKLNSLLRMKGSNYETTNPDPLLQTRNFEQKSEIIPMIAVKKESNCVMFLIGFVVIVVACGCTIYFKSFNDNTFVNSDVQLKNICGSLQSNIHGQKNIVDLVIRTLEQRMQWKSKIKILTFVGTSGVGKTFVSNVIKKQFPRKLIHEIYGGQLMYKTLWKDIANSIDSSNFNLIIVDDVKKIDIMELLAFINTLPQNQFILVLSIFNMHKSDILDSTIDPADIGEIQNAFDDSGLYYEIASFQQFTNDQVEDWIKKQLAMQNIDQHLRETIKKNVLQGHNVKYHGLKGLNAKLLLELGKLKT